MHVSSINKEYLVVILLNGDDLIKHNDTYINTWYYKKLLEFGNF